MTVPSAAERPTDVIAKTLSGLAALRGVSPEALALLLREAVPPVAAEDLSPGRRVNSQMRAALRILEALPKNPAPQASRAAVLSAQALLRTATSYIPA